MRSAITGFLGFQDKRLLEEGWWNARRLLWFLFSFRGRIGRIRHRGVLYTVSFVLAGRFHRHFDGLTSHKIDPELLAGLFSLATLVLQSVGMWIALAPTVKRLHDRGQSGWSLLVGLIPVAGALRLCYELWFRPGTPGNNQYGEGHTDVTQPY